MSSPKCMELDANFVLICCVLCECEWDVISLLRPLIHAIKKEKNAQIETTTNRLVRALRCECLCIMFGSDAKLLLLYLLYCCWWHRCRHRRFYYTVAIVCATLGCQHSIPLIRILCTINGRNTSRGTLTHTHTLMYGRWSKICVTKPSVERWIPSDDFKSEPLFKKRRETEKKRRKK